ncbi:hypothetical protein L1987_88127 [Smallanthus sonchifolius]|nr:hypothetical protein L1987_88127 [Smallanthus sonchifolius]
MDYATLPLQIKEKSYASDTNRAHLEKKESSATNTAESKEKKICYSNSIYLWCTWVGLASSIILAADGDGFELPLMVIELGNKTLSRQEDKRFPSGEFHYSWERNGPQASRSAFLVFGLFRAICCSLWRTHSLSFRSLLDPTEAEEKKTNYVVLHPQEFQSSSNQSVIDYCLCHLLLTLQRPFLTCNKAYFFRKIFDLCCHSQLPMQSDEKKVVRRTISNGEKLSSNRRGGTARSFGDKCFLRRSDPVERKSSSFFSSLRKAIVNIQAEVVSE